MIKFKFVGYQNCLPIKVDLCIPSFCPSLSLQCLFTNLSGWGQETSSCRFGFVDCRFGFVDFVDLALQICRDLAVVKSLQPFESVLHIQQKQSIMGILLESLSSCCPCLIYQHTRSFSFFCLAFILLLFGFRQLPPRPFFPLFKKNKTKQNSSPFQVTLQIETQEPKIPSLV